MKCVFLRSPAMGGGECKGTRAARGGEWPRDAMRAGGALCAFLLVAWMAAVVTRSPTVPDAVDPMAKASPPQRERGVGAGQARASEACDDIRYGSAGSPVLPHAATRTDETVRADATTVAGERTNDPHVSSCRQARSTKNAATPEGRGAFDMTKRGAEPLMSGDKDGEEAVDPGVPGGQQLNSCGALLSRSDALTWFLAPTIISVAAVIGYCVASRRLQRDEARWSGAPHRRFRKDLSWRARDRKLASANLAQRERSRLHAPK